MTSRSIQSNLKNTVANSLEFIRNLPSFLVYEFSGQGKERQTRVEQTKKIIRDINAKKGIKNYVTREDLEKLRRRNNMYNFKHHRTILSLWLLAKLQDFYAERCADYHDLKKRVSAQKRLKQHKQQRQR